MQAMGFYTEGSEHIMKQMNELRKEGNYDVIIEVEEKLFSCHRHVIAAACPILKPMILKKENWETEKPVLKGIDSEIFEIIVEYIYTNKIQFNNNNWLNLLKIADYLGMDYLMEMCKHFLESSCPPKDLLDAHEFAVHLKDVEFIDKVEVLIAKHIDVLYTEEKFSSFPFAVIKSIMEKIKKLIAETSSTGPTHYPLPAIIDSSQSGVFYFSGKKNNSSVGAYIYPAVMKWIKGSVVERIDNFHELSGYLTDFPTKYSKTWQILLEQYREELKKRSELSSFAEKIHIHILENNEIKSYAKIEDDEKWTLSTQFAVPAIELKAVSKNRAIFNLSYNHYNQNQFWTSTKNGIFELRTPPALVSKYQLTTVKDMIYLYDSGKVSSPLGVVENEPSEKTNLYTYIEARDKWYCEPCAPKQLFLPYFVSSNNSLFLIGGTSDLETMHPRQKYVQQYDPRTAAWNVISSDVDIPLNGGACAQGNNIFIYSNTLTGNDEEQKNRLSFYTFDNRVNKWIIEDNQFEANILVPFESKLWAFSRNPRQGMMIYNFLQKNWQRETLPGEFGEGEYQVLDVTVL